MVMHARKSALGFYEKLGYTPEGDEFEEVTIPHYLMRKKLL
jgi:predicted GNAT family N-acyltransferase